MTLLKTPTLKKMTVAVLALALVSWLGVGIYRFKTDREIKKVQEKEPLSSAPSPTISPQKSPYTGYTDEINQFFIEFPKVWKLDLKVESENRAFTLSPTDEVIYPEISLSIEGNAEKLSIPDWVKINYPGVEEKLLRPATALQLEGFTLDEASKSTIYVNDKDSSKMYVFSAYPVLEGTSRLTDEGREKFVKVVSTFELRR